MINNFSCFKVTEKKNENSPDYRLTAKVGEEYVDVGAGWVKDGKSGKYISFQLSKPYQDKSGFALVATDAVPPEASTISKASVEYPEATANVDEIPF
jgi:uncharacterized protein (DUF736 family)